MEAEMKFHPPAKKFSSKSDLAAYFGRDKLECLICGRRYIQLVAHIGPAHDMTADDYKDRFGIPWTYGLAGKKFKANSSRRIKSTRESGRLSERPSKAHIARLVVAAKNRRKSVGAVSSDNRRKILATHKQSRKWGMPEFNEFLARIASGRTPTEVGSDSDLPTVHWFRRFIAQNKEHQRKFEAIWNRVPYGVQARAYKLSPQFAKDLVALRRKRLLWSQIASKLGVTETTVRHTWFKLRRDDKLAKTDLAPKPDKFSRRDYELFLRKFAKGQGLRDIARDPRMPSVAQFYRYLEKSPSLRKEHARISKARIRNRK